MVNHLEDMQTENNYTSVHKNSSLFQNDNIFYVVLITTVSVVVILGIFLFICMACKPSIRTEDDLRSDPIEFPQNNKEEKDVRSQIEITNGFSRKKVTIISANDGNQNMTTQNSLGQRNESISILDTRLPPLVSQPSNNMRPGEIEKLRNALEEAEQHRDVGELSGTHRTLHKELETLDITSLTQLDNSF